jgi:hypothetical protein
MLMSILFEIKFNYVCYKFNIVVVLDNQLLQKNAPTGILWGTTFSVVIPSYVWNLMCTAGLCSAVLAVSAVSEQDRRITMHRKKKVTRRLSLTAIICHLSIGLMIRRVPRHLKPPRPAYTVVVNILLTYRELNISSIKPWSHYIVIGLIRVLTFY